MDTNHLTDNTIQSYILQEISDSQITLHISQCADCKAKLESYQTLMNTIGNIEPEIFDFDVAALVLQKIEEKESPKIAWGSYALAGMLCICILSVILFSVSIMKPLFQLFSSLDFFGNVFIIVSAVCVFIFLFSDMLRQYKQNEKLLLQ